MREAIKQLDDDYFDFAIIYRQKIEQRDFEPVMQKFAEFEKAFNAVSETTDLSSAERDIIENLKRLLVRDRCIFTFEKKAFDHALAELKILEQQHAASSLKEVPYKLKDEQFIFELFSSEEKKQYRCLKKLIQLTYNNIATATGRDCGHYIFQQIKMLVAHQKSAEALALCDFVTQRLETHHLSDIQYFAAQLCQQQGDLESAWMFATKATTNSEHQIDAYRYPSLPASIDEEIKASQKAIQQNYEHYYDKIIFAAQIHLHAKKYSLLVDFVVDKLLHQKGHNTQRVTDALLTFMQQAALAQPGLTQKVLIYTQKIKTVPLETIAQIEEQASNERLKINSRNHTNPSLSQNRYGRYHPHSNQNTATTQQPQSTLNMQKG